mmetsp:Transcript_84400/g.243633  ORF Transcript_84400/g.243633 Transcript_84400/m.243633 type:complete len:265 (+) Transcript_84400:1453-2247(+)
MKSSSPRHSDTTCCNFCSCVVILSRKSAVRLDFMTSSSYLMRRSFSSTWPVAPLSASLREVCCRSSRAAMAAWDSRKRASLTRPCPRSPSSSWARDASLLAWPSSKAALSRSRSSLSTEASSRSSAASFSRRSSSSAARSSKACCISSAPCRRCSPVASPSFSTLSQTSMIDFSRLSSRSFDSCRRAPTSELSAAVSSSETLLEAASKAACDLATSWSRRARSAPASCCSCPRDERKPSVSEAISPRTAGSRCATACNSCATEL